MSHLSLARPVSEIDTEVCLDDTTLAHLPVLPPEQPIGERLRLLELERRAAYSQMHRMMGDIGTLKYRHERSVRDMELAQVDAMYRLALLAEYRNGSSSAKVLRIGVMAALVANALGCSGEFCERLQMAAPLHDVGEIGVPDSILWEPVYGEIELQQMRHHCQLGAALLGNSEVPELQMAAEIARCHHERYDGGGYPAGKRGDAIPLAARIVAVVDCFDALTCDRPDREARPIRAAIALVLAGSGEQFDPKVTRAFLKVSELLGVVRQVLDESAMGNEARQWLEKPPAPGFWRGFV
jgi:putative two-component system response regulator